jgi:8-oxo-dGTP diphosphatase
LVRGDGAVLLADRPAGKPYAGHWEFPGGKIENGESIEQALAREMREELDLQVERSDPWVVMDYDYPHAFVRLYFRRILEWTGTPRPLEGQRLHYLDHGAPAPTPLLPAAVPALRWIQLPAVVGHSPGTAAHAGDAQAWLDSALARGLRQVLWHEPGLDQVQLALALAHCREQALGYGARLLVDARSARRLGPDAGALEGIFMDLAQLRQATARPPADWVGAGVQSRADVDRAAALGCDFAVLEADADPERSPMAQVGPDSPLPIYVVAALSAGQLDRARRAGAHGLALPGLP